MKIVQFKMPYNLLLLTDGSLDVIVSNIGARNIRSTALQLAWELSDDVEGYVVTIADGFQEERTQFVSQDSLRLDELIPGQTYTLGGTNIMHACTVMIKILIFFPI